MMFQLVDLLGRIPLCPPLDDVGEMTRGRGSLVGTLVALASVGPIGMSSADPSDMRAPAIPLWPWPDVVVAGDDDTVAATVSSTAFDFQVRR